jgi:type III pantothenate kinase
VSQENVYEGGFILPGWNMQLKAMYHFTDKLPLWSNDLNKIGEFEIGKSTESAMTEGVVHSISSTIDGLIDKIENKIGEATVILTGGDAESFETRLKSKIFVHPNLVLEGLNKILSYNVDQN